MDEQNSVESSLLEDLERMSAEREMPTAVEEDEIVTTEVFEDDDEDEGRPLFQNKKANIAIGIACAVVVIGIIAACVYAFVL